MFINNFYTKNGYGTATAIKLAKKLNIPVFNFGGNGGEELKKWWKNL